MQLELMIQSSIILEIGRLVLERSFIISAVFSVSIFLLWGWSVKFYYTTSVVLCQNQMTSYSGQWDCLHIVSRRHWTNGRLNCLPMICIGLQIWMIPIWSWSLTRLELKYLWNFFIKLTWNHKSRISTWVYDSGAILSKISIGYIASLLMLYSRFSIP